jgi:hypothetical protein
MYCSRNGHLKRECRTNVNNHNHVNNNMVNIQEHTSNNLTPRSLENMV